MVAFLASYGSWVGLRVGRITGWRHSSQPQRPLADSNQRFLGNWHDALECTANSHALSPMTYFEAFWSSVSLFFLSLSNGSACTNRVSLATSVSHKSISTVLRHWRRGKRGPRSSSKRRSLIPSFQPSRSSSSSLQVHLAYEKKHIKGIKSWMCPFTISHRISYRMYYVFVHRNTFPYFCHHSESKGEKERWEKTKHIVRQQSIRKGKWPRSRESPFATTTTSTAALTPR